MQSNTYEKEKNLEKEGDGVNGPVSWVIEEPFCGLAWFAFFFFFCFQILSMSLSLPPPPPSLSPPLSLSHGLMPSEQDGDWTVFFFFFLIISPYRLRVEFLVIYLE